ncbi:MAG: leucine-rich repeat protein [Clostridia bacterium]|nr:leucine-rich repeat protein [Clostridia bacterium]
MSMNSCGDPDPDNVLTCDGVQDLLRTRESGETFTVPEGVTVIGREAFRDLQLIKRVVLPASVAVIENNAFDACSDLEEIALPDGLIRLGDSAFAHTKIRKAIIPESVKEIGAFAFFSCSSLAAVSLPSGLNRIGKSVFHGCGELTDIRLPPKLKKIGKAAFFGCGKLKKITLPDSMQSIDETAFINCHELDLTTESGGKTPYIRAYLQTLEKQKNTVILSCPTCGEIGGEPLPACSDGEIGYAWSVKWGDTKPSESSTVDVEAEFPFFCRTGDYFTSDFGRDGIFIRARLTEILSVNAFSAVIRVRVESVRDECSYVRRLSQIDLEDLDLKKTYYYEYPVGDSPTPRISWPSDHMVCVDNSFGGGDLNYTDYIFTDEDGLDHLVAAYYSDHHENRSFHGDRVLGLCKYRPFYWENGLLIDNEKMTILGCSDDTVEAVIPDGIQAVGRFVFTGKQNLESITIPHSVRIFELAFSNCPKVKTITLYRLPGPDHRLENELRRAFSKAKLILKTADPRKGQKAPEKKANDRERPLSGTLPNAYEDLATGHRGWRARHIRS